MFSLKVRFIAVAFSIVFIGMTLITILTTFLWQHHLIKTQLTHLNKIVVNWIDTNQLSLIKSENSLSNLSPLLYPYAIDITLQTSSSTNNHTLQDESALLTSTKAHLSWFGIIPLYADYIVSYESHKSNYLTLQIHYNFKQVYIEIFSKLTMIMMYILLNCLLLCLISYNKIKNIIFSPLQKLTHIAEQFKPEDSILFPNQLGNNQFNNLSIALNGMLSKIKFDQGVLEENLSLLTQKNNELVRTQKQLLQAERFASIGKIVASLAHEIGNPLGIIQGYIELLSDPSLPDNKRRDYSERCLKELDRISTLMEKLLTTKPTQTEAALNTNITTTCLDAITNLKKQIDNNDIEITFDSNKDIINIDITYDTLYQVALNLLLNSIESINQTAGKKGLIEIEISDFDEKDYISIIVSDNGVGIETENIDNIFEPFFSTKDNVKGTGLGLYTCHQLLNPYKGTLQLIETSTGKTTFEVTLPKK